MRRTLILKEENQQVSKVGESERKSFIAEPSFGLSVLLTSGLTVQEYDATEAEKKYSARNKISFQNNSRWSLQSKPVLQTQCEYIVSLLLSN